MSSVALPLAAGLLPQRASSVAEGVDHAFALIFWICAFFFALIVACTVWFVIRFRARPSRLAPEPSPSHHTPLELLWSGIPLLLVFVIFGVATKAWLPIVEPAAAADPLRVQVTGRKWSWWFDHPGGKGSKELHLVVGRPAVLVLASTDVIHSLYVPEFRMKQDAVPGRETRLHVTPTLAGSFPILCAEYCGTNHSRMSAVAVVHPDQPSFDAWAREGRAAEASLDLVALGRKVYEEKGCVACHTLDGSPSAGPTFKNLFGRQEKMEDGSTVRVDEAYIRESILQPTAKITAGFPPVMPPIPLEERELQAIVALIQSLGGKP